MLPATVTVCAAGSIVTTSFMGCSERKQSLLSAMWLKEWRVPRTLSLLLLFTWSRTCCSELVGYRRSVPYSILPAQFLSLSAVAHANAREAEGTASAAVRSFMKALLFIARVLGGGLGPRT